MHATAPTKPSFSMETPFQALPSPLLNWRPAVDVTTPVKPNMSTTTHNTSPPSELRDFSTVEEYVAYLERQVGRVELISFRVRTPDGRLTLFESEMPTRSRRSSLKVDVGFCTGDAVDVAERNLAEWEETMPHSTVSMPDMRPYRNSITDPAPMMCDTHFCSPSSFSAVGYSQSHIVQGMPMMPQPSPGSLQSLVAAANVSRQPLLNIRPAFASPLSPSMMLPPTPPNNVMRAMHMHSVADQCSNSTTPTANLFTPPDSPDFAEGSESPNSGCSTEGEVEDESSASAQRTSLKPSLPGCQHSAHWKRLRHKKGTTHFLCALCGCKWRRVSRDGEE